MRDNPCHGCQKRCAACHSACKDYGEWKNEREELNKKAKFARTAYTYGYTHMLERSQKNDMHARTHGQRCYR